MKIYALPRSILMGICTLILSVVGAVQPTLGTVPAVTTNRYDNLRSGTNLNETQLNTTNVTPGRFGKLFERPVLGDIYAQPLYVSGVTVPGKGVHNIVYIVTAHNMAYAFDADDPSPAGNTPLWKRDFASLGPIFSQNLYYEDIWGMELGILSTPVINLANQTIYMTSMHSCGNQCGGFYLHALNIATGADQISPVLIEATMTGDGDGNVGSVMHFNGYFQLQRPGLLLLNNTIYIAFGGSSDRPPYHGWLLGYDATTLQQVQIFNATRDGNAGGIWQSGTGLTSDGTSIYVVTGNGKFDANTGGRNYGQSIIRLNANLTVASFFTPYDYERLNDFDLDLGINGAMLLPGTNLAISGSKEGKLYLVDRTHMGGFNPTDDSQIVQTFSAASGHMHSTPLLWDGPNGLILYIWTEQDHAKAFRFNGATLNTVPVSTSQISTEGMPAGILSLSADGHVAGTGILWGTRMIGTGQNGIGVLHAFDATVYPDGIMRELWNSEIDPTHDRVGGIAKFNPPMVANGKVYVGTFSDKLSVYGLLPNAPPISVPIPVSPGNGLSINDNTPLFIWGGTVNTPSYQIQIDNNSTFDSPEQDHTGTAKTYQATTLVDGKYYWRVRAVYAASNGAWSPTHNFMVDTVPLPAPLLLAPANGAVITNQRPSFTWSAVAGAHHYEMRLDTVNPPLIVVYNGSSRTYMPLNPLEPNTYYWTVLSMDAAGNPSTVIETRTVSINSANNAAPIRNTFTTDTPTLSWSRINWATRYKIEVDTTATFSSPLAFSTTVPGNQFSTQTSPLEDGTYFWRVTACSSVTTCGGWSAADHFVINTS